MKTQNEALALTLEGAAEATTLSKTTLSKAIDADLLPVRRYGNRTLILMPDLKRFLESLPEGRPAAPLQFEGRRPGRPRKAVTHE